MRFRKLMFLIPIVFVISTAAASAQTLRVSADRTSLRDKPSTDGVAVASLVKGDELSVIERAGSWYRVRVRSTGAEGFVNSLLVDVVSGGVAVSPAPSPTPSSAATPPELPRPTPAPSAAPLQGSSSSAPASDRKHMIRVFGGLLTGYGDMGFAGGGGVGMKPFDNDQMEVAIDGLYGRSSQVYLDDSYSTSVLAFSGNFLYNFQPASQSFSPFAGGGLVISRASIGSSFFGDETLLSGTFTSLQLIGGIEKPLSDRRAFRAEIRTGFASFGGSLLLLGGLSF